MAKIGYARVSSTDQDFDGQADRLRAAGCTAIYSEKVNRSMHTSSNTRGTSCAAMARCVFLLATAPPAWRALHWKSDGGTVQSSALSARRPSRRYSSLYGLALCQAGGEPNDRSNVSAPSRKARARCPAPCSRRTSTGWSFELRRLISLHGAVHPRPEPAGYLSGSNRPRRWPTECVFRPVGGELRTAPRNVLWHG
jgi:hypothetical protein